MKTLFITLLALCLALPAVQAQTYSKKQTQKVVLKPTRQPQKQQAKVEPLPPPAPSTLTAKAHMLHVFADNGEKFFLILDGQRQNEQPLARVTVKNLDKGYYRGKIIFDDERLGDVNSNIQLEGVEPGYNEVTYIVKKKTKKGKTTYSLGYGSWKKIGETDAAQGHPFSDDKKETTHTIPDYTPPTPDNVQPAPAPAGVPCGPTLPEAAFQGMLTSVANSSFEDVKVQTASVIADGNCLTALQVKQIIQKFGFEESRLNFARNAYARCLDKQNYLVVNEAFQFSSSKSALNEFILGQKK